MKNTVLSINPTKRYWKWKEMYDEFNKQAYGNDFIIVDISQGDGNKKPATDSRDKFFSNRYNISNKASDLQSKAAEITESINAITKVKEALDWFHSRANKNPVVLANLLFVVETGPKTNKSKSDTKTTNTKKEDGNNSDDDESKNFTTKKYKKGDDRNDGDDTKISSKLKKK